MDELPEGWDVTDLSLAGHQILQGPCPTCGVVLAGEESPADVIARHTKHLHRPRPIRAGRHFPDDAAVTVGAGATLYRLGRRWSYGDIPLESLTSGQRRSASLQQIRWDGETFHARTGFRNLVYRERPELRGTHGAAASR